MDPFDMAVEDRMCEQAGINPYDFPEPDDFEVYNQNEADDYRDEN
jgi:hypothetical protein